jgi:hypothetical protein
MELVMDIIKVLMYIVGGSVAISATYTTIQYFRLYRPLMKYIKETGSLENGEAK